MERERGKHWDDRVVTMMRFRASRKASSPCWKPRWKSHRCTSPAIRKINKKKSRWVEKVEHQPHVGEPDVTRIDHHFFFFMRVFRSRFFILILLPWVFPPFSPPLWAPPPAKLFFDKNKMETTIISQGSIEVARSWALEKDESSHFHRLNYLCGEHAHQHSLFPTKKYIYWIHLFVWCFECGSVICTFFFFFFPFILIFFSQVGFTSYLLFLSFAHACFYALSLHR